MPDPDLTVTVVSWNTVAHLRRCLHALTAEGATASMEIHVVDNASTDGSPEMVRAEFPDVELLALDQNVGFARANNLSWRRAQGRFWMLCNPDTEVQPGSLRRLVDFLDLHPAAGLVTPALVDAEGRPRRSPDLLPGITRSIVETLRVDKVAPPTFRHRMWFGSDRTADRDLMIGWACGAALVARREAVETCGALSEDFFVYGEDLEWCLRLRRAGWQIWLCPEARVVHHESVSTARRWSVDDRQRRILDGLYRAVAHHRRRSSVRALIAAQLVALRVESVIAPRRGRTPPSRALLEYHRAALRRPPRPGQGNDRGAPVTKSTHPAKRAWCSSSG